MYIPFRISLLQKVYKQMKQINKKEANTNSVLAKNDGKRMEAAVSSDTETE